MERRDFIKNSICLSCLGALTSGCGVFIGNNDLKNDRFYYKSKEDLPKRIRIEACSLCQLDCPVCPIRRFEKQYPKDWLGYLKFDDFKKFVDDNDFIELIDISNHGEIFLNPELDEIIEYAHSKGVILSAVKGVNLNTVSDKMLENLVKYKFKSMVISLDGATPETYKIYRRGGDFNKVIDNIKKINYYKEKYNSELPKLTWQFIVFGHNEHEIELAKKKAHELNMEIKYVVNHTPSYSPVKNKEMVKRLTGLESHDTKQEFMDYKLNKDFVCYKMFDYPQIDYDGTLLGCCQKARSRGFNINVFKLGLLKSLNHPDFIYAKHMLTNINKPPKEGVPCTSCPNYIFLRKQHKSIRV